MPDGAPRQSDRLVVRARAFSLVASGVVMLVGAFALAGWIFDVDVLKGFYGGITMKANAAVSLVLAGASLWLLVWRPEKLWARHGGQVCAVLAGAVGAATLSQHIFGWDLGIDQLLFDEAPGALATASPGRMGPPASTCFTLAGIALLLLHGRRRPASLAQLAAVGIGLMALLPITGYAYGVETLYGIARFTGIALHTAVALFLLSCGILAGSADRGFAAVLTGTGAGSLMARRLLVFALTVPLLLGWLRIQLETAGYLDTRFGIAALILTIIVILATIVVRTARVLNGVELQQLIAEAKLRDRLHELETMMEVAPIGLFIATDPSARQIVGNRTAREFLRMPEPDQNLSLSAPPAEAPTQFRVFHDGVEVPPEELPVQRAARDGVAVQNVELEVLFADGTKRHELISALPLLDQRGRSRGAVASMMDITARHAAEKEREALLASEQEARAVAEAASRAKDEFLATLSHELRTPLNAILGWTTMLRENVALDDAARERALATIERNCRAQAQLIEDLLDVSRIVAGNLRLDVKPVDLVAVIQGAVEVVRPAADARSIELRTSLTPAYVRGDASRLQQVVWNLLTNAVKFSPRGAAVDVELESAADDAVLTVTDRGEGIDAEFVPYVFERFRQADSKKTRRHSGVGLGLAIARHLVEMHGGTIEVASEGIGRGARFTVRLPALRLEDGGAAANAARGPAESAAELPAAKVYDYSAINNEEVRS